MNNQLEIKDGYNYKNELKKLFNEYTDYVCSNEPNFKKYLELQNYDDEIKHLEVKYGYPTGRLFIALYNNKIAGCIALKKISDDICEMKRLYVRGEYRGLKIGNSLVAKIIEEAKNIGYKSMVLDTFNFLESAIKMYKKYGFYEIEKYNDSPIENAIYMKLDL